MNPLSYGTVENASSAEETAACQSVCRIVSRCTTLLTIVAKIIWDIKLLIPRLEFHLLERIVESLASDDEGKAAFALACHSGMLWSAWCDQRRRHPTVKFAENEAFELRQRHAHQHRL